MPFLMAIPGRDIQKHEHGSADLRPRRLIWMVRETVW